MTTHYDHKGIQIFHGDVLDVLRSLPAGIVQTVVTSPPYWGLRDYGVAGQLGLEKTPEAYVAKMVEVFREVRRVLRDDGTVWLNLGDCYMDAGGAGGQIKPGQRAGRRHTQKNLGVKKRLTKPMLEGCGANQDHALRADEAGRMSSYLKPKDLCMIPARVALALQADGWYLRSDIIWAKGVSFREDFSGSVMPGSQTDRPTTAHEYVFLLSKRARYFYDAEAVKEKGRIGAGVQGAKGSGQREGNRRGGQLHAKADGFADVRAEQGYWTYNGTRNVRDVWAINPKPYTDAHFATFPPALPEVCIKAGTSEHGACAGCGAPWARIVQKSGGTIGKGSWNDHAMDASHGKSQRTGSRRDGCDDDGSYQTKTIGWQPTCKCPSRGIRLAQVVMDPFHGSGTTGMVSKNLGRHYIGIELKKEYIEMSLKRIRQDVLPMVAV